MHKSLFAAGLLGLTLAAHAALPVDEVTTIPSLPVSKNRLYVGDFSINHILDGRLYLYDADSGKFLSTLGTGFGGQFTLSPDRRELYVSTTYLTRGQRGDRIDVLEVWDADTLVFKHEILLDSKRAQALNYRGYLRTSPDGRLMYVQNATPATSVTIVDLQARRMIGEVETPGCWGLYPSSSHARRFSALCGDGTIATFTLNDDGTPRADGRANSEPLFDAQSTPLFIHAEQDGDRYRFVSFVGELLTVDLGGDKARKLEQWSLLDAEARKAKWRPGGYQLLAHHKASGRLYVGMHAGGKEGSHKLPADEIWVYDLATRKRVSRLPGDGAIAINVPVDASRQLYVIDGIRNALIVRDGPQLKVKHRLAPLGDTPALVEVR